MPIRLLAFDKDGCNIQLIGRNQIFSQVLPGVFAKIAEPEFQSAWAYAETLEDSELVMLSAQRRSNTMKEVLASVVEQSVDYAILSHTWMRDTPGDVTFKDWATREGNPRGNAKIVKFCQVTARDHNITLGWIDTVCINKDSSSELDESIRSMYNWYQRASVCITYLSETTNICNAHGDSWFTRGWTLQELLAQAHSVFYNTAWNQLGLSSDAEIQSVIFTANGITGRELELSWSGGIEQIPLSRRLQMASSRQVTREEDASYSLMGILGVDISIAYGEGTGRAFSRIVRALFKTKKNIIDLFNRSYDWGEGLFPSSLESYRHRSDWHSDYSDSTYLDDYPALYPIIPTHMGVCVPLLLVPGLVSVIKDDEQYTPKGAFSGKTTMSYFSETSRTNLDVHIFLLDSRLYTGDLASLCTTWSVTLPDKWEPIAMRGILNFGVDDNNQILLPEQCFAVKLYWDGLQQGNFVPSGSTRTMPGTPAVFKLEYKKGLKIHKTELERHGMRLVSLYL